MHFFPHKPCLAILHLRDIISRTEFRLSFLIKTAEFTSLTDRKFFQVGNDRWLMSIEIKKTVISFEPEEVMELERIILDGDEKTSLEFLRKSVHSKMVASQKARLHSHDINPARPEDHLKNK